MKLIWQPNVLYTSEANSPFDFSIELDAQFARYMAIRNLNSERKERLQQIASERLEKIGVRCMTPYSFLEDSCLVQQFNLEGEGRWLALEREHLDIKKRALQNPLQYTSHNIDRPAQAHALLYLVSIYVEYADLLIEE